MMSDMHIHLRRGGLAKDLASPSSGSRSVPPQTGPALGLNRSSIPDIDPSLSEQLQGAKQWFQRPFALSELATLSQGPAHWLSWESGPEVDPIVVDLAEILPRLAKNLLVLGLAQPTDHLSLV